MCGHWENCAHFSAQFQVHIEWDSSSEIYSSGNRNFSGISNIAALQFIH